MNDKPSTSILHISATREDHGGLQCVLRQLHARNDALGLTSRFVSIFDRAVTWPGECVSLAVHGWMRVGAVWQQFAAAVARWHGSLAIYHDGWGVEWFAPHDGAKRRIVYLHTERPHANDLLRLFAPRVDGMIVVSRVFAERVRRVLPNFPSERLCVLYCYVEPPAWPSATKRRRESGPLRIGYAGRVQRGAKRLDRLPGLIAELDRCGVEFSFEVLGDGSYLEELRQELRNEPRVALLGWLSGNDYWRKVAEWDVVLMLSDFEGYSRAVMECMCAGAIPVHPDFSPAAGELLGPAAQAGLYPTGDMRAAAAHVAAIARLEPEARAQLRSACVQHMAQHSRERFEREYREFLRRIENLPPHVTTPPAAPRWHAWLPLGVFTRLFPNRF